ncbi:MAG: fibronectin type III domain-containing protein [Anaerovoracaceae bacterium]
MKIITAAIIATALLIGTAAIAPVAKAEDTVIVKTPNNLKAVRKTSTSLKLSWSIVSDANGYIIYKKAPGKKQYSIAKTINTAKTTAFVSKKLKTNKTYSYKIRAYKIVDGAKIESADSYVVTARAYSKKSKYRNASSVSLATYEWITEGSSKVKELVGNGQTTEYLGLERWYKKGARPALTYKQRKAKKKVLSKSLYWKSSNPAIVKVTGNGELKAQGVKGTAVITIRTHNGIQKSIRIYVDDYANPAAFTNLDKIPAEARDLLTTYPTEIKKIMNIIEEQELDKNTTIEVLNDELVSYPTWVEFGDYYEEAEAFFKTTEKTIEYYDDVISMSMEYGNGTIVYSTVKDAPKAWNKWVKLADCWFYVKPEFPPAK